MNEIIYDILFEAPVSRGVDVVNVCARHGIDEDHEITGAVGQELDIAELKMPTDSLPVHFFRGLKHPLTTSFGGPLKLWIARYKQNGDTKVELQPTTK